LESFEQDEVVEFSHEYGAGQLSWNDSTGGQNRLVSVCISREWLDDPQQAAKVAHATRNLAACIAASLPLARSSV
jgi:hypothetical protein